MKYNIFRCFAFANCRKRILFSGKNLLNARNKLHLFFFCNFWRLMSCKTAYEIQHATSGTYGKI